jgi:hypothetical protein
MSGARSQAIWVATAAAGLEVVTGVEDTLGMTIYMGGGPSLMYTGTPFQPLKNFKCSWTLLPDPAVS